ncbi:MAG TPA: ion channel [Deltaproteobacteria bacterium]|nr:ion channel [Deltaproteobacteria bacterium]HQI02602.1 ion channel [Deltaproteobacteria bacterium]HQJ09795.1 ion channel [Deltaproteobacteria bacterium]
MGDTGERLKEVPPQERETALGQFQNWVETPMVVLAFVWFALLIIEYVWGISPLGEFLGILIWIVFIAETLTEIVLTPDKGLYVRHNWIVMLSLFVPAFRIFRVLRLLPILKLASAIRGLRLIRVVSTLNRTMHALQAYMRRGGFGYVVLSTVIVVFGGAAGMLAFEKGHGESGKGLEDYGDALWWTAMIMTTMGSDYWPRTGEGRVLCFLLALYAFSIFGYFTAFIASILVGRGAGPGDAAGND